MPVVSAHFRSLWANPSRDLSTFGDSIWTVKIWFKRWRFDLRFHLNFLRFHLKKNWITTNQLLVYRRSESVALLLRMQLGAKIAPLNDNDWHCNYAVYHAIWPKIYCVKHCDLDFLRKISLHIYFCERFEIWLWTIWDLKKNGDLRFWLNGLSPFLERFESWVKNVRFAYHCFWVTQSAPDVPDGASWRHAVWRLFSSWTWVTQCVEEFSENGTVVFPLVPKKNN